MFKKLELVAQAISNKIFGTKWRYSVKKKKKKFGIYFRVFLTLITKFQLLEERLGTSLCVHPNLRFF